MNRSTFTRAIVACACFLVCGANAQVTVINRSTGQPPANLSGHDTSPYNVSFDAPASANATYDVRWTPTSIGTIGSITINGIHADAIIRLDIRASTPGFLTNVGPIFNGD